MIYPGIRTEQRLCFDRQGGIVRGSDYHLVIIESRQLLYKSVVFVFDQHSLADQIVIRAWVGVDRAGVCGRLPCTARGYGLCRARLCRYRNLAGGRGGV